jgi:hypothetical protein
VNKDSINELPRARKEKLIIKEVDGEMLVYDLTNDKAHCLNQTAARIWQYCDGNRSIAEIAELMSTPGNPPVADAVVLLALDQLQKFALLETKHEPIPQLAGMNRRELVRRIGIGALALPIIISITAPTASAQASNPSFNLCCNSPGDCIAPLTCKQNPTCIGIPAPSTKACIA